MLPSKQELLRKAFLVPCESKEALGRWLRTYLDVDLFSSSVSRFSSAAPLDAAWDLYKAAVMPETRSPSRYLFVAARSTQKTLSLAALQIALLVHDRRNMLHFAAAESQLEPFRLYIEGFLAKPFVRDLIDGDTSVSVFRLAVPKHDSPAWLSGMPALEILKTYPDQIRLVQASFRPISPTQVQGMHVPGVFVDEIHTLSGHKLAAYKDIPKIPIASIDGKPWVMAGISSRKGPYTVVEQEMADAATTGIKVRQWTVFEGIEPCPDSRSGTDFTHERYVNIYDGSFYTAEEFSHLDNKVQAKCQKTVLASGCLSCPLARFCLGDLKKEKPKNKNYQSIEAAITDVYSYKRDPGLYLSQCLSLQPSKEGLVFSSYDSDIHEVTPDEMYERFTGQKPLVSQSLESLVALFHRKGLKAHAGVDHGFSDPFAINVGFTDGDRMFIVYNYAQSGMEPEKHIKPFLADLYAKFGPFPIYPDTSRPEINKVLKDAGFDIQDDFVKKIDDGVSLIRGGLAPLMGPAKLFFLKGYTKHVTDEMTKYHYDEDAAGNITDKIVDDFNHSCDALRYLYLNVFGTTSSFGFSFGSEQEDAREKLRKSLNLPTSLSPQPASIPMAPGMPNYVSSGFKWDFDTNYDDSDE